MDGGDRRRLRAGHELEVFRRGRGSPSLLGRKPRSVPQDAPGIALRRRVTTAQRTHIMISA
eukprot:10006344-Lingulodinium_polyedra.AAC.1